MHGAGNDFFIVESSGDDRDWEAISVAICERHFGAGADGLMLLLPSSKAHVRMRLFNSDGSEAEVSGNGVRCLVRYAIERGVAKPDGAVLTVEAIHDVLEAQVSMAGSSVASIRLSMGQPKFAPADIPVLAEMAPPVLDFPIDVGGEQLAVSCMSIGNPHAVHFLDTPVEDYPLESLGPAVENHPAFPARVNFGIANVLDRSHMDVRVWERGAGETLACGSGCCAAMVMAHLHGLVDDRVDIKQPGGMLTVEWDGQGDIFLGGAAEFVYDGDWPD